MMTALSMIETVFESTPFHVSCIAFLTKTRFGTADMLRYGSLYVDLPKVNTMSELEYLLVVLGFIVTGSRPTPDRGMESCTNPHPNVDTPLDLSMLMVEMWYEMLNENTAGIPAVLMTMVGMAHAWIQILLNLGHKMGSFRWDHFITFLLLGVFGFKVTHDASFIPDSLNTRYCRSINI